MTKNQKNREPGFYWVKFLGDWEIAEWCSFYEKWYVTGVEDYYLDRELKEIEERRIIREEPTE